MNSKESVPLLNLLPLSPTTATTLQSIGNSNVVPTMTRYGVMPRSISNVFVVESPLAYTENRKKPTESTGVRTLARTSSSSIGTVTPRPLPYPPHIRPHTERTFAFVPLASQLSARPFDISAQQRLLQFTVKHPTEPEDKIEFPSKVLHHKLAKKESAYSLFGDQSFTSRYSRTIGAARCSLIPKSKRYDFAELHRYEQDEGFK